MKIYTRKRICLLLATLFLSLPTAAQKASVNFGGTIVDAFTRHAINGEVICSLLRPDSTVLMTTGKATRL